MPITHQQVQQIACKLNLGPSRVHEMVARRAGEPVSPWLAAVWSVLAQGGHGDLLEPLAEPPTLLEEEAKAFAGMRLAHHAPTHPYPDELLAISPAERMRQVQALLEVVWSPGSIGPANVGGEDASQQALQMRLWRAQADRAIELQGGADPSAALRALAQAPHHGSPAGQPLRLPLLLVAQAQPGQWQGRLVMLRLWRWHCPPEPAQAAPRAWLHLLPTLAQACVPLTLGFARSLQTVAHWLRSQLPPDAAADTALVWDLAPEQGSMHLLAGPSASAAAALAGAWLLRDHFAPAWRQPLQRLAANDFSTAYLSAELQHSGALAPVGGIVPKDGALTLPRLALGALGREQPLHVAHGQAALAFDGEPLPLLLQRHDTLLSVAQALKHRPMTPEQARVYDALAQALAALPQPPGPADRACPDHQPPTLPPDDTALNQALAALCDQPLAQPCTDPLHLALRCWAERGRAQRNARAGASSGQIHQRFVNLQLALPQLPPDPQAPHTEQRDPPPPTDYATLEQLLADFEHGSLRAERPSAVLIEGAPGSGKSFLMQRHVQALCEQFIWHEHQGAAADRAMAQTPVLPLYLSLNLLPADTDPVAFYRDQLLATYPDERLGLAQRLDPAQRSGRSHAYRLRLLVDGLNEIKANHYPDQRAKDVLIALWKAFQPDLPLVLGIRPGREWALDDAVHQFSVRKATLAAWKRTHIQTYLERRWGAGSQRVKDFLAGLPEGSAHETLLGTPLYLNLQCELWEAGAQALLANRAHLLAAMLWLRLGQELNGPAGRQALGIDGMVSLDEAQIAHAFAERPGHPPEFPLQGWLLKGLFAQAKAQWLSAPDAVAEVRGQVSLPWTTVQRNLMSAGVPRERLGAWRDAVKALGLARWERTAGQEQFQFEHQVFGEWLASAALFTTGAHTGPGGGRLPSEQPLPEHWSAEALVQLAQDLAPPPLARSAEDELEAQRQRTREAWADPRLDGLLDEWREHGLRLPLAELQGWLDAARDIPFDGDNMLEAYQRPDLGFIQIDAVAHQGAWHLGQFGDFLAKCMQITWAAGARHWSVDHAAWAQMCQREEIWPVFRDAAQNAITARVGNEQTRSLWAKGGLGLPPPGSLDDIVPLALDALGDEALLAWLGWIAEQSPWALLSTSLVRSRDRLRQWAARGEAQAAAVARLWSTSSQRLLAVVNDASRPVGGADPRQRLQAGELLGAQGEPGSAEGDYLRFERTGPGLRLREPHWLPVGGPGLRFRLGDPSCGIDSDQFLWLGDGPGMPELPAFQVAQMPVTVAEYRCFIDAGGYGAGDEAVPAWWQAAGVLAVKWLKRRQEQGAALQPSTWSQPGFDNPLQPVTGVTWFEAMAYCAWANVAVYADWLARLNEGAAGRRWTLRLPTEWEWEAAMRGPHQGAEDACPLAWPGHGPQSCDGDAPKIMLFNHVATALGRPSPVGCWGGSCSLLGLLDGVGNVYTWCANLYHPESDSFGNGIPVRATRSRGQLKRAKRGGSFIHAAKDGRVGKRFRGAPDGFSNDCSFRLVLAAKL